MKQRNLFKKLKARGFVVDHHGSNYDIYKYEEDEFKTVERHNEISERLERV